jgi:hypothetical protein
VLAWSFRGLSLAARNACVAAASRTLVELAARSEFDARRSTAVIGSARPAVPSARCTGCAGFPRRALRGAVKRRGDSSLRAWRFLQSVAQRSLAARPQPPAPLMDSRSLQHIQASAVHRSRAFQARFRSAFRVWSPSSRFAPAGAGPALFHAGSARGIRPSERSPPAGYPVRFRPGEPTCRFSRR